MIVPRGTQPLGLERVTMDKNQYFVEFLISLDRLALETGDVIFHVIKALYGEVPPLLEYVISSQVSAIRNVIYNALKKVQ